jgi:hypothetical protein
MPRLIGAVVAGYLAVAVAVFAGLSVAYLGLGADRAFRPGAYDVSMLWIVISVVVSFSAAMLGGWVALRIARTTRGPRVLAAVVVVLGLALALPVLFAAPEAAALRSGALGNLEAMRQARTPLWMMLLNPMIGALGVLVGGRALGRSTAESAPGIAAPVA